MSVSQEYPVILGKKYSTLPRKTKSQYILLPDYIIYRKKSNPIFCEKCDVDHEIFEWSPIVSKDPIGFIDIRDDIVTIISPDNKPTTSKLKITNIGLVDKNTELLTYTITVTNISPNLAKDVEISSFFPNVGSKWVLIQPKDKCSVVKDGLCCNFKILNPDESVTIKVSANIKSFCDSPKKQRKVFCDVHVTAANAPSVEESSITVIPYL